jgi:hypothetical protein
MCLKDHLFALVCIVCPPEELEPITFYPCAASADHPQTHDDEAPRKRLRELRDRPENDHWFAVTVEVSRTIENISKLSVEGQPHTCIVNLFLDIGAIVGVSPILCQEVFLTRSGMETSVKS